MSVRRSGIIALSPLILFLALYLLSSLLAGDFYKVPIASAFLIASVYAVIISKERKVEDKIAVFSSGAGNPNVLLMIWIFVLAGAFASTAKAIGAIDATVNLTLMLLPGKLIYAGLFIAACFISMSVGTSVGTIVALVPIATGLSSGYGIQLPMLTAVIVGGAFFGDNLSFISDTTIASTKSQGCSMSDKFRTNIWIAAPAALAVTAVYVLMGLDISAAPAIGEINALKLVPYLMVIVMAIAGINVTAVLSIGIAANLLLGLGLGESDWLGFLESVGSGISGMGELIIVTMLAGGMLEVIRHNGGIDYIIKCLTKGIKNRTGAQFSIAALVALANLCTANNTIAIITTGGIAKDISTRYGIAPRKSASIMDSFSCVVQGVLPYGAQLLMASGLAGISAVSIIAYLYYPMALLACACVAIILPSHKKTTVA